MAARVANGFLFFGSAVFTAAALNFVLNLAGL